MGINRISGLVLPYSTKYLIDDIIGKRHINLLMPLVLAVLGATLIQGVTSFSLTQLLSKAAQRLISELRRSVQEHIGRLPVTYYDSNKTGMLVSRIMSDVEGVRNLIGTGLVEFVGGLLTAVIALVVLLRISALMTGLAFLFLLIFGLALRHAFRTIRPIFRARAKINAEVTGRLTESLGGVRVIKGYHAEDREAQVFAGGVQRLLDNVLKSLTATSVMSLGATMVMGMVGVVVMFVGAREILAGTLTVGGLMTFTAFLAFLVAPVFQVVAIGTQISEALAGLERTREVMRERPEDEDPRRTNTLGSIRGEVDFERVRFAYEPGKPVLKDISFASRPGTVTALIGPSGSGKSTIIGLISAFYTPSEGVIRMDGVDLSTVRLDSYRTQLGVVLQDTFLFDGTIRENVAFSHPNATEQEIMDACKHRARRRVRRDVREEVRHHCRRARSQAVGRPKAARLYCACHPGQPADLDSGRGHLQPRLRIRSAHSGRSLVPDARPHHFRHRASPLDHPARRPDPGRRSRPDCRTRNPRIALRRPRPILRSLHPAARPGDEPVSRAGRRRHCTRAS